MGENTAVEYVKLRCNFTSLRKALRQLFSITFRDIHGGRP